MNLMESRMMRMRMRWTQLTESECACAHTHTGYSTVYCTATYELMYSISLLRSPLMSASSWDDKQLCMAHYGM